MTYTNLTKHDLTTQLHLKFFLIAQHEVKRQKRSNAEQRTANVKMSRTMGVVWLVNPILIILHLHCQIRRGASVGSTWQLQEYTGYQKTYLNYVQFFVRMCHRLYENRISVRIRAEVRTHEFAKVRNSSISTWELQEYKAWFKRRILHAPNQILILVDSNKYVRLI